MVTQTYNCDVDCHTALISFHNKHYRQCLPWQICQFQWSASTLHVFTKLLIRAGLMTMCNFLWLQFEGGLNFEGGLWLMWGCGPNSTKCSQSFLESSLYSWLCTTCMWAGCLAPMCYVGSLNIFNLVCVAWRTCWELESVEMGRGGSSFCPVQQWNFWSFMTRSVRWPNEAQVWGVGLWHTTISTQL